MAGQENKSALSHWLFSIAVSVVFCSLQFLVFAGYIMDLNRKAAMAEAKMETMLALQTRAAADLDYIRKAVSSPKPSSDAVSAQPAQVPPPVDGAIMQQVPTAVPPAAVPMQ